eukprot:7333026-Pyramimonas_sp.AAC.1
MLDEMLPRRIAHCGSQDVRLGDLQDAFFDEWRWAERSECMGLEDTEAGKLYRLRFSLFGGSECPNLQQRFATTLVKVLNRAGKRLQEGRWPHTVNTRCVIWTMVTACRSQGWTRSRCSFSTTARRRLDAQAGRADPPQVLKWVRDRRGEAGGSSRAEARVYSHDGPILPLRTPPFPPPTTFGAR